MGTAFENAARCIVERIRAEGVRAVYRPRGASPATQAGTETTIVLSPVGVSVVGHSRSGAVESQQRRTWMFEAILEETAGLTEGATFTVSGTCTGDLTAGDPPANGAAGTGGVVLRVSPRGLVFDEGLLVTGACHP